MKTCGAVERPKQRAKKWKTLPNSMNRRKYPEHGCIGKSRYTTIRIMNLAHEARELILAATTPRPVDRKLTAVKAQRRKRSQLEGSLSEQRLHCPGKGFVRKCGGKKPSRYRFVPQKEEKEGRLWKNEESAPGATRYEMYLMAPPCGR